MNTLEIKTNPEVEWVFGNYPASVRTKMLRLRKLIVETAEEIQDISKLDETLKWGEPSYIVKNGSTVRIDWKEKKPHEYAVYFKCTSKLVQTFKMTYGDLFKYEGNRAIAFRMEDEIPRVELKNCITSA